MTRRRLTQIHTARRMQQFPAARLHAGDRGGDGIYRWMRRMSTRRRLFRASGRWSEERARVAPTEFVPAAGGDLRRAADPDLPKT